MGTALKLPAESNRRAQVVFDYDGEIIFRPKPGEDLDALYERICQAYEDRSKIEQDEKGNVHVMAPTGGESGNQSAEAVADLVAWARRDGRGKVFDSSTAFLFKKTVKRVPDAAWVSKERLFALPYSSRRKFLPVVPEFVIEIKSPSDNKKRLEAKMQKYLSYGVDLGWLIDPDGREVKIYTSTEISIVTGVSKLRATGPVEGFTLNLRPIWLGLQNEPNRRIRK
jgi:Uma2 family endonuclease